jgi:hypothetical protein
MQSYWTPAHFVHHLRGAMGYDEKRRVYAERSNNDRIKIDPAVQELRLDNCGLEDIDLEKWADMASIPNLRRLSFKNNPSLTPACLASIDKIVEGCPFMTHLLVPDHLVAMEAMRIEPTFGTLKTLKNTMNSKNLQMVISISDGGKKWSAKHRPLDSRENVGTIEDVFDAAYREFVRISV